MSWRELLFGSSFSLTSQTAGGGSAAFWGRGAVTRFDGREGETSLDGEVTTAMLGADWSLEKVTARPILGHSLGDGGYRGASGGGTVSSTLTGLYPWGRYAVSERVSVWGVAGWGEGTLSVTPENVDGTRQAVLRADLDLAMGAAGLRGTLDASHFGAARVHRSKERELQRGAAERRVLEYRGGVVLGAWCGRGRRRRTAEEPRLGVRGVFEGGSNADARRCCDSAELFVSLA